MSINQIKRKRLDKYQQFVVDYIENAQLIKTIDNYDCYYYNNVLVYVIGEKGLMIFDLNFIELIHHDSQDINKSLITIQNVCVDYFNIDKEKLRVSNLSYINDNIE